MKTYDKNAVDRWIRDNDEFDSYVLFDEMLPKHRTKLNQLDKRIANLLTEIQEVFPDARYYTASGGFTLVLGDTHEGHYSESQRQRSAWSGIKASIGDGDW